MSAYSEWKCGAISDDEYTWECNREAAIDRYLEEKQEAEDISEDEENEEQEKNR